jgi:hypothetical protein
MREGREWPATLMCIDDQQVNGVRSDVEHA